MSADEGVQRYIDMKRAVIRNMGRVQDQLVEIQAAYPLILANHSALRRIQAILDDPFAVDGLSPSP